MFGNLPACQVVANAAVANAVRAARLVQDTVYLNALGVEAFRTRVAEVFVAAEELVQDRTASTESRVMGVLILMSHLGNSPDVMGHSRDQLFTVALPSSGLCGFAIGGGGGSDPYYADERSVAQTIDRIRYDAAEPTLLRNLARCARSNIDRKIPPQVDVSALTLSYSCGDWFLIHNPTGIGLPVRIRIVADNVVLTSNGKWIPASPMVSKYFALETGTVELWYDGQRIATATNNGIACPS